MFLWLFVFIGAHVIPTYLPAIWDYCMAQHLY